MAMLCGPFKMSDIESMILNFVDTRPVVGENLFTLGVKAGIGSTEGVNGRIAAVAVAGIVLSGGVRASHLPNLFAGTCVFLTHLPCW